MKTTLLSLPRLPVLAAILAGFGMLSATAQTATSTTITPGSSASVKGIGAAPAHSKQNHILSSALSPQTRQTLQQAMDSYGDAAPAHPAAAK